MLAGTLTTLALTAAIMGMIVSNTFCMEVIVVMGMYVVVLVFMNMGMGVRDTVMGMLMGVGVFMVVTVTADMIVVQMHKDTPLHSNAF